MRFELGDPKEENEKIYYDRVYNRSKTLFSAVHHAHDELFIVAHDYQIVGARKRWRRAKLVTSFLREKNMKYTMQHQLLPFNEDEDEVYTHQFSLKCRVKDINEKALIKALFASNMSWIYFVNITKGTIFHIYDDRGCDLVATKKEAIRGIYNEYNDWILNYDKKKIDDVFQ